MVIFSKGFSFIFDNEFKRNKRKSLVLKMGRRKIKIYDQFMQGKMYFRPWRCLNVLQKDQFSSKSLRKYIQQ